MSRRFSGITPIAGVSRRRNHLQPRRSSHPLASPLAFLGPTTVRGTSYDLVITLTSIRSYAESEKCGLNGSPTQSPFDQFLGSVFLSLRMPGRFRTPAPSLIPMDEHVAGGTICTPRPDSLVLYVHYYHDKIRQTLQTSFILLEKAR